MQPAVTGPSSAHQSCSIVFFETELRLHFHPFQTAASACAAERLEFQRRPGDFSMKNALCLAIALGLGGMLMGCSDTTTTTKTEKTAVTPAGDTIKTEKTETTK